MRLQEREYLLEYARAIIALEKTESQFIVPRPRLLVIATIKNPCRHRNKLQ